MMVNMFVALSAGEPLSVTRTATRFVVLACATEARQTKTPLERFKVAFGGACTRLNVRVWGGASGSEARLVMTTVTPAFTTRSATGDKTGAVLAAWPTNVTTLMA